MQGLRSIAAVIAGFGFMASTVMVGTILATALFLPGGLGATPGSAVSVHVPLVFFLANLATSFFGAVFGGWLAARIGTAAPLAHAVGLAVLTAGLAAFSAYAPPAAGEPSWYPIAIGVVGVAGVLLGGKLRATAASAAGAVVA
jgi:hypothetical protein